MAAPPLPKRSQRQIMVPKTKITLIKYPSWGERRKPNQKVTNLNMPWARLSLPEFKVSCYGLRDGTCLPRSRRVKVSGV